MDLEILMQEDRTDITGAVLYSADIFNASTAEGVATHVLVRLPLVHGVVLPIKMLRACNFQYCSSPGSCYMHSL